MKRWILSLSVAAITGVASVHYLENRNVHAAHLPTAGAPRIAQWRDNADAAVSFTFDDALQCHADIAAPMLHEFGLRATFFVPAGLLRQHPSDPRIVEPRLHFGEGGLSWDEVRHIHDLGMEIGNHSLTHAFLNHITDDAVLDQQVNHAADLITQNIGEAPLTFAFPYNEWTPHAAQVVLQHHVAFRDKWTDYGGKTFTTEFADNLVKKAIATHAWLVPMVHGIDGGFLPLSSQVLREHLAFIKAHLNELWVSTYADVARYQMERTGAALKVEDSVPGETTFFVTPGKVIAASVPLTVIVPLPLNENTDNVDARVSATGAEVPVVREADRLLVDLPPGEAVRVTWH